MKTPFSLAVVKHFSSAFVHTIKVTVWNITHETQAWTHFMWYECIWMCVCQTEDVCAIVVGSSVLYDNKISMC